MLTGDIVLCGRLPVQPVEVGVSVRLGGVDRSSLSRPIPAWTALQRLAPAAEEEGGSPED